jgi:hypothetical protein
MGCQETRLFQCPINRPTPSAASRKFYAGTQDPVLEYLCPVRGRTQDYLPRHPLLLFQQLFEPTATSRATFFTLLALVAASPKVRVLQQHHRKVRPLP